MEYFRNYKILLGFNEERNNRVICSLIYKIKMMKLFNFSLGGNATTSNIKEESVTLSICVCVCVFCVCKTICACVFKIFFYYMKQRVKKINLKKLCIKQ